MVIGIRQLYPYILECDFPIEEFTDKHISSIKEDFEKFWDDPNREGNDMVIRNEEFTSYITLQISNIIENIFIIGPKISYISTLNLYVQTNTCGTSYFHNHVQSPGNVCTTFYKNIPKEGGEIIFNNSKLNGEVKIKPKINKLYIFPKWLDHTPLPQLDKEPRFCFNWDYPGALRPTLKKTGELW